MWNARLDEAQSGIKIARRDISTLRYTDDTTLVEEREEELKNLLMKVKDIQKTKILESYTIISWQIGGKTMETVKDYFWVLQITADGDCSHEIKRCLLLGRKVMTNLDSMLRSRDITLLTKVCLVKAMVFPVVKYRGES